MPKFELHKIAIVNPQDLNETVVITTVLEGSDGATRAFVEDDAESYVVEDNQSIEDTLTYKLSSLGLRTDSTDEAQLYTWANNGTKLTIVGYAYDEFLHVENAVIRMRAKGKDRRTWMIHAQKSGGTDFDSSGKLDTEFMASPNGLNMYNWQEGSTADVPAGWTKTGGSSTWDDANNRVTFTTTGATTLYMRRELYFPFPNKQLTFFIDITGATENTGISLRLVALDSSGSSIGSASTTAVESTGQYDVTRTLPANTHTVRMEVAIGQNDSVTFRDAGLSIGTSTNYISR